MVKRSLVGLVFVFVWSSLIYQGANAAVEVASQIMLNQLPNAPLTLETK